MKKYIVFSFVLFFALLCSGCGQKLQKQEPDDLTIIKQRGYLIAGVKTDSPPFGYYREKRLEGIDIEIVKNIASNIFDSSNPDKYKLVEVNPQNRIAKLNAKEVDILVATMSVNDKRKLIIDFSKPYFVAGQKLMVKKESKISHLLYFNKEGILGVVLGTTGEKIIHLIAPNARIVGARSYGELVGLLAASKIDGIIGDDCILEGYNNGDFKIINKAYSNEYYAVALRKSPKSKELLGLVNVSISEILDGKKLNLIKKMRR